MAFIDIIILGDANDVLGAHQTRSVSQAIAEKNFTKAMSLRDPEFSESLEGFFATSALDKEPKLPHHLVSCASLSSSPSSIFCVMISTVY